MGNAMKQVDQARMKKGFTLIELMIVVLVIAVLAAIAYPSYQQHVVKSRRAAAQACMQEVAQFMERYYTTNLKYTGAAVPAMQCRTDLARFYTIGLQGAATAKAFTVQATPTSAQNDPKCGTLSANQVGTTGASGTSGAAGCW